MAPDGVAERQAEQTAVDGSGLTAHGVPFTCAVSAVATPRPSRLNVHQPRGSALSPAGRARSPAGAGDVPLIHEEQRAGAPLRPGRRRPEAQCSIQRDAAMRKSAAMVAHVAICTWQTAASSRRRGCRALSARWGRRGTGDQRRPARWIHPDPMDLPPRESAAQARRR